MATIGLRDVHYALLTDDPLSGIPSYAEPIRIIGAITANINPNSSASTLFYDDGPGDTAATIGEISLELNLADIPLETQAAWLGHEFTKGILKRKGGDTPPWLAIGFRTLKSNGAYRYIWLTKGKFSIPEEEYNTKGDSIEFGTPTITGSFVKRDCDDEWQRSADEGSTSFDPSYVSTWFLNPVTIAGAYDTQSYGNTKITISGKMATLGATIKFKASASVDEGDETSVWSSTNLTITLADKASYSRAALQALIDEATGTAPGKFICLTDSTLVAAAAVEVTLTMKAAV